MFSCTVFDKKKKSVLWMKVGGVIMKGLMWFSTGPTILDNVRDNVLWFRWSGERIQTSKKTLVRFFNLQPSARF